MDDIAGRKNGYGSDRWTLNGYLDTKTDLDDDLCLQTSNLRVI